MLLNGVLHGNYVVRQGAYLLNSNSAKYLIACATDWLCCWFVVVHGEL
jgi:hypothetical protein